MHGKNDGVPCLFGVYSAMPVETNSNSYEYDSNSIIPFSDDSFAFYLETNKCLPFKFTSDGLIA